MKHTLRLFLMTKKRMAEFDFGWTLSGGGGDKVHQSNFPRKSIKNKSSWKVQQGTHPAGKISGMGMHSEIDSLMERPVQSQNLKQWHDNCSCFCING